MKSLFAVVFASIYGLTLRLVFGFMQNLMGIMSITFLILLPVLIGFLTVMLTPNGKIKSNTGAFFTPWLTSAVILVVTILLQIEGAICWIMIFPLFAILAGFGGIVAFKRKQIKSDNADKRWENYKTLDISLLFLVPVLIGSLEGERGLVPEEITIKREIVLNDSASVVWRNIINTNPSKPEKSVTLLYSVFDFPKHAKTTLDTCKVGGKRMVYYDRGLFFEETITQVTPNKRLVLDINVDPTKIPPTVMDEHILIGGKHLDILEDIYELEQQVDGKTRLTLSSRFYINTPFNWYARVWAKYLMVEILDGELELIKFRSTAKI